MLIDTRDQGPEPEPRRRRDLSGLRRFSPFGWAAVMLAAVDWTPPLPGYVLIVSACWLICRGLSDLTGMDNDGLRDHRQ